MERAEIAKELRAAVDDQFSLIPEGTRAAMKEAATQLEVSWRDIRTNPPPVEAIGLVVLIEITCNCAKGAMTTLSAGRMNGEWVIEPFEHSFEIRYWYELPAFPQPPKMGRRSWERLN